MDNYINNYEQFKKIIVYNFNIGCGGIGDYLKYFKYLLLVCIKLNIKLYHQINNIYIEKYLKLKYHQMYISVEDIKNKNIIKDINLIFNLSENTDIYNIISPYVFYSPCLHKVNTDDLKINFDDLFYFSNDVKFNSHNILPDITTNYISLHLRLGDKYLETDKSFIVCQSDYRTYDEEKIFNFIEQNQNKNIIFFCDNNTYRLIIKNKYKNITITNSDIGHTSLLNTTDKQTLDTITDLYIMTNSEKIIYATPSGFSYIASQFKNIPFFNL